MRITRYLPDGNYEVEPADIEKYLKAEEGTLWLDITNPGTEHQSLMRDVFRFHPLPVEDVFYQEQRPKAEEFTEYLFLILNPASLKNGELDSRELSVFVGKNYVVTVHMEDEPILEEARQRIDPERLPFPLSATYLIYVILDTIVDNYLPIFEGLDNEIDRLGEQLLTQPRPEMQARLFQLKRTLNTFWWIIWPQQDIINALTSHHHVFIDGRSEYYLRDIDDHLQRITNMIQASRDSVTGLINLYVSAVSNQLNVAINRLTIFTIVLGILAVFGGFYGMNFEHTWPPYEAVWGAPVVLLMMVISTLTIFAFVRRR